MAEITAVEALAGRVAGFTAFLRGQGFSVGAADTALALQALPGEDLVNRETVLRLWRSVYAKTASEWEQFPTLFFRYFSSRPPRFQERAREVWEGGGGTREKGGVQPPRWQPAARRHALLAYSPDAGSPVPLVVDPGWNKERMASWTQRALQRWQTVLGFRQAPPWGPRIAWRETARESFRYGGEIAEWVRQRPSPRPVEVVALLDVSGSMRSFVPFYLALCWQLQRSGGHVRAFVASNRVEEVTRALRRAWPGSPPLLPEEGLGGGTRLGEACLWLWERRATLPSRAIWLIASDGYDAGDLRPLVDTFPKLSGMFRRVIWLNPLLLEPDYVPRAQAMRVALPYCHEHVGVRDADSWIRYVRSLGEG
ncbi:MAG: VWA domain-containing protein [Firmicutes bacterium]|nr:VWA domain-containing protein [Bacillota bacterium]